MIRGFLALLPLAAASASCQTIDEQPASQLGRATLYQADGQPMGTARLFANGQEVTISVSLTRASPGTHGMHLHMTGACDGPDFTTAGSHLNPGNRQHGAENPAGSHLGDLPNVTVGEGGTGSASAILPGATQAILAQVFDADGTAIVIHASADDYRTDPSGNSGGRMACGVINRN